ncbi:MAG TPA: polysaccharide biosynthesis/export family protein [Pyrinomonadaceae bacterium]|nr:polysaccharide biosynthesis/export family protein [Pyrinomonadaceae bacterium]
MIQLFRKKNTFISLFIVVLVAATNIAAQKLDKKGNNNPYSPSPTATMNENVAISDPKIIKSSDDIPAKVSRDVEVVRTTTQPVVPPTSTPAKNVDRTPGMPVETYNVGIGDVLFVNLKNAPNASGYYTVRDDGTIDFPLAGDNVVVKGKTASEITTFIQSAVTLYSNPQVEVKVREFSSHKINVTGMAERKGERTIQREAVPLFVVIADVNVDPTATKVLIRRNQLSNVESYNLSDAKTDNIIIYPGNSVEFAADERGKVLSTTGFYYIAGEINTAGQKEYATGMTLFQAITAAGGAKGNPKKATIRRKIEKGSLNVVDYDLRAIKAGKATDPVLSPGDMIEIAN